MLIVIGNSTDKLGTSIGQWYAKQKKQPLYEPFAAIGFLDYQGYMQGAAIFTNYNTGGSVAIHIYGPKCVNKANIKCVLNYVFNELKCSRLTVIIERKQKIMLKLLPRLLFKYEAVLKKYFGSEHQNDGVVFRMTSKEASKWIKINA